MRRRGTVSAVSGLPDLNTARLLKNGVKGFMQRLIRLMCFITLIVLASASFAGPNADTNLASTSYCNWTTVGMVDIFGTFISPDAFIVSPSESDNKLVLADEENRDIVYVQSEQTVNLCLHQKDMSTAAAGYQAFLSFDQDMLSFTDGAYTASPYGWAILGIGFNDGVIDLASGINPDMSQTPCADDAKLADLNFVAGLTEGATQVVFRDHLPVSRFSDIDGYAIDTLVVAGPMIIVDNTPPTDLTLTVAPQFWTTGPVTVAFSATDALSGIDHYELDFGSGEVLTVSSPYVIDTSLLTTGEYTVTVTAFDRAGNFASISSTMWIAVSPCIDTISTAKELEDGTILQMAGPVVTRVFDGYFYIEDSDRSSGIRVNCDPEQMPELGHAPLFTGTIQIIDGERVIVVDSIQSLGPVADVPLPLAMIMKATKRGLSPVGLLVRMCGKVVSVSSGENKFVFCDGSKICDGAYDCDGSQIELGVELHGVSLPALGEYITVTGALGSDLAGPLVRVNDGLDLQIMVY